MGKRRDTEAEAVEEEAVEAAYELQPHTIRRGRPSKYKPEYAKQAEKLCKLGLTDAELAELFEVTTVTIWRWCGMYPEFCKALKLGKDEADARVERSLYQRAVGYEVEAVKITAPQYGTPKVVRYKEAVQPDVTACIFWLKNRQRDKWRDKQEHEHSGEVAFRGAWAEIAKRGKSKAHEEVTAA